MTQSFESALESFQPQLPIGVAFSGGADSTALLVACAQRWPGQVIGLHVNHNLQAAAPAFQAHCESVCRALNIALQTRSVDALASKGQSPEDAARNARYEALVDMAHNNATGVKIRTVAIAQHADDQVETIVLALGRGAGLAGISGMAPQWQRGEVTFVRPLLRVHRTTILQWLSEKGVQFVEDPTNDDVSFTRNAIRASVLPALHRVFPQFRETFARSAGHAAQAQTLLDEIGAQDLQAACVGPQEGPSISQLQTLSDARLTNVLRWWLKSQFTVIPSQAQLAELMRLTRACKTRGHDIHLKVGQGFVRREGRALGWYNPRVLRKEN